jgi:hypothetical protein
MSYKNVFLSISQLLINLMNKIINHSVLIIIYVFILLINCMTNLQMILYDNLCNCKQL